MKTLRNDTSAPFDLLMDSDGNLIEEPVPADERDFPEPGGFVAWLCEQAGRDDPIGDLGSDLVADAGSRAPTYAQLLRGVEGGCDGARRALEAALRQYQTVAVFS
jgi:hypothetical protein